MTTPSELPTDDACPSVSPPLARRTVLAGAGALSGIAAASVIAPREAAVAAPPPRTLDSIVFGDSASEAAHGLSAELSSAAAAEDGALAQRARVFHPTDPQSYWGGGATFTMKVARTGTTYVSVKLWGGDFDTTDGNEWRLHLYAHIDGQVQQIGYQEQGVIDSLDARHWQPRSPGRFFLHTVPLPEALTSGRTELTLEIRATGRIWSYGGTPEKYYYPMTEDSRPVYAAYTHDAPYLELEPSDVLGTAPTAHARPSEETLDALEAVRDRVDGDLENLLVGADPARLDGWQIQELVEAYMWDDPEGRNPGYAAPETLARIFAAIDGRYRAWQADPRELTGSSQQWQGFGRYALALYLLGEEHRDQVEEALDQPLAGAQRDLVNPSFEIGRASAPGWTKAGWLKNQGEVARVTDTAAPAAGMAALRITNGAGQVTLVDNATVVPVIGGQDITVSAWIRTEGTSTSDTAGAALNLVFRDPSGTIQPVDGKNDTRVWAPKDAPTTDWTQVEATLTIPAAATQLAVSVRLWDAGTAWFDGVVVPSAPAEHDGGAPLRRRAYGDMMAAHMIHWRRSFPHYTNQIQICSIGLYQVSRALQLYFPDRIAETGIAPDRMEEVVRGHVEEGLGLRPWMGRFEEDLVTRRSYLGSSYRQVTHAGLTRELGYVGNYGEVHDWLVMLWEAIVRGDGAPQDGDPWVEQVTEHVRRLSRTRLRFRVVEQDEDGARVVQEETVTGWRNEVYPGKVAYVQPTSWDGNPLQVVTTYGAGDAELEAAARQLDTDGQLGRAIALLHERAGGRVGLNAFRFIAHHYPAWSEAGSADDASLPVEKDFVFADPENGIVAVRHGEDLLWATTYFRARQGINSYGRVHLIRDGVHRSATVRITADSRPFTMPEGYDGPLDAEFGDGDYEVPGDLLNFDYAINDESAPAVPGLFGLPEDPLGRRIDGNGLGGTVLPRARLAADVLDPTLGLSDRPSIEAVLVGRPEIATLRYGGYIVVINSTSSTEGDPDGALARTVALPRTGTLTVLHAAGPTGSDVEDAGFAPALKPGATLRPGAHRSVTVPPLSVLVLRES